jgi:hypothetical protein
LQTLDFWNLDWYGNWGQVMAALDALFFHLYGLGHDDAAYILDAFPIVRDQDTKAFGHYRTKDDVLAKLAQIEAGRLN